MRSDTSNQHWGPACSWLWLMQIPCLKLGIARICLCKFWSDPSEKIQNAADAEATSTIFERYDLPRPDNTQKVKAWFSDGKLFRSESRCPRSFDGQGGTLLDNLAATSAAGAPGRNCLFGKHYIEFDVSLLGSVALHFLVFLVFVGLFWSMSARFEIFFQFLRWHGHPHMQRGPAERSASKGSGVAVKKSRLWPSWKVDQGWFSNWRPLQVSTFSRPLPTLRAPNNDNVTRASAWTSRRIVDLVGWPSDDRGQVFHDLGIGFSSRSGWVGCWCDRRGLHCSTV